MLNTLIDTSCFDRGMKTLINNQKLREGSNCHGTVLWILGYRKEIDFVGSRDMIRFLDRKCYTVDEEEALITAFGKLDRRGRLIGLEHTGVYLGSEVLFDQAGSGGRFGLREIEDCEEVYKNTEIIFYFPKKIVLPQHS